MRFEVFLGNTLQVKHLDAKEDGLGVVVGVVVKEINSVGKCEV
jgi:hypothetical protein